MRSLNLPPMPKSLEMRFLKGMTVSEISEATRRNKGAVKAAIERDAARYLSALKRHGRDAEIVDKWDAVPKYLREIVKIGAKNMHGCGSFTYDFLVNLRREIWWKGGVRLSDLTENFECDFPVREIDLAGILSRIGFAIRSGGMVAAPDAELSRSEKIAFIFDKLGSNASVDEIIAEYEKREGKRITKSSVFSALYGRVKKGEICYFDGRYVETSRIRTIYDAEKIVSAVKKVFESASTTAMKVSDVAKALKKDGFDIGETELFCILISSGFIQIGKTHIGSPHVSTGGKKRKRTVTSIVKNVLKRASKSLTAKEASNIVSSITGGAVSISPNSIPSIMKEIGALSTEKGYVLPEKTNVTEEIERKIVHIARDKLKEHESLFLSEIKKDSPLKDVRLVAAILKKNGFNVFGRNEAGVVTRGNEDPVKVAFRESSGNPDEILAILSRRVFGNPPKTKLLAKIYSPRYLRNRRNII